jgi:GNAT superfamily N-acetyltransferase
VELSAGERFREVDDARIASCADHPPTTTADLHEAIGDGAAWVTSEDGEVAGFLMAEVFDDALHVAEVAVRLESGGRGHATALLDEATAWAVERGLTALTLTTFRDVPFNRPFYERRGFRVLTHEELTPALAGRRSDEAAAGLPAELRVAMRRDLRS